MPNISLLKHGFFNKSPAINAEAVSFSESEFDLNQLRTEFFTLYHIFVASKNILKKDDELVLYLSRICKLLVRYYRLDYVEGDLRAFLDKKREIDSFIAQDDTFDTQNSSHGFSTFIGDRMRSNYMEFVHTFTSSSKFRKLVSILITNRSYWSYSRTLANCIVMYLLNSQFIEFIKEINTSIGVDTNPEEILQALEKPQAILRALSILLYSLRFIINLSILIKHVYHAAKSKDLSATKVLLQEIEKRFYLMLNDLAWGIVNLLSSYNQFFNIPLPVISQINLAFLAFDILLFLASWYVEGRKYQHCLQELRLQRESAGSAHERAVIKRQINMLDDEWKAQCAFYKFNIAAAVLLIAAFGASLVLTGGFSLIVLAALSMLGNALYNSCNDYKNYQLACITVEREQKNGRVLADDYHYDLLRELELERTKSRSKFWNSLVVNGFFTAFVITAAAISWPIAVTITACYLVYKVWDVYEQSQDENKALPSQNVYRLFKRAPSQQAQCHVHQTDSALLLT